MAGEFGKKTLKVLLVDDMESNLYAAAGLMRKLGLAVDCLTNGKEALDRVSSGAPHYSAIFMDHMMPDPDGIETAKLIRAIGTEYAKELPIIALTGNTDPDGQNLYLENGFRDVLYKPIEAGPLEDIIKKWVCPGAAGNAAATAGPGASAHAGDNGITIDIPGLDSQSGLGRYGGDVDIYLPIMRSYAKTAPQLAAKLRGATAETLPECVVAIHGLKGAGASICAENAETAAELEKIARGGDLAGFTDRLEPFLRDTERLAENIDAWFGEYDEKNKKPRLQSPGSATLEKLRQSCEAYDISGIDEAMDELEGASYETGAGLVEWLREKVDAMELGDVISRLSEKEK